jgi:hypothetical protein
MNDHENNSHNNDEVNKSKRHSTHGEARKSNFGKLGEPLNANGLNPSNPKDQEK